MNNLRIVFAFVCLFFVSTKATTCDDPLKLVKDLVTAYENQYFAFSSLPSKFNNPENIPYFQELLKSKEEFNAELDDLAFLAAGKKGDNIIAHPQLGVLLGIWTLQNTEYQSKLCGRLGGVLFEPDFTDIPVLCEQTIVKNGIRLPIFLNNSKATYISGNEVGWIKKVEGLTIASISADEQIGFGLRCKDNKLTAKTTLDDIKDTFYSILCSIPYSAQDVIQNQYANEVQAELDNNKLGEIINTLDFTRIKFTLLVTRKNVNCTVTDISIPEAETKILLFNEETEQLQNLKYVTNDREGQKLLLNIAQLAEQVKSMTQQLEDHYDFMMTDDVEPANHGDITRLDFNFSEVEEQIIIGLAGGVIILLSVLIYVGIRTTRNYLDNRRRTNLRRRHPDINDMPLAERSMLM